MTYLKLAYEFFKTGLLAIGGGLATVPFLREISQRYGWFTESELIGMIAVAESTPGPVGINMAAYAGIGAGSVIGGIIAVVAIVLPSLIIILIIAKFLKRFGGSRIAAGVFLTLRPAAAGLIAGALFSLLTLTLTDAQTPGAFKIRPLSFVLYALLTSAGFAAEYIPKIKKINVHPIIYIAAGAALGIIFGGSL